MAIMVQVTMAPMPNRAGWITWILEIVTQGLFFGFRRWTWSDWKMQNGCFGRTPSVVVFRQTFGISESNSFLDPMKTWMTCFFRCPSVADNNWIASFTMFHMRFPDGWFSTWFIRSISTVDLKSSPSLSDQTKYFLLLVAQDGWTNQSHSQIWMIYRGYWFTLIFACRNHGLVVRFPFTPDLLTRILNSFLGENHFWWKSQVFHRLTITPLDGPSVFPSDPAATVASLLLWVLTTPVTLSFFSRRGSRTWATQVYVKPG